MPRIGVGLHKDFRQSYTTFVRLALVSLHGIRTFIRVSQEYFASFLGGLKRRSFQHFYVLIIHMFSH
jgi:hypothetical protein